MVAKALIVAGLVFALYAGFIARVKPYWSISQHKEQQDNQIKAEKYIYDYQQKHGVIVGSSLSSRLGNLPGTYNLAMDGLSSFDGLAIVLKQKSPPHTVLIEMNFVDREEDTNFTGIVNNPVLKPAKAVFLSMRADKQPLSVAVEQVQLLLDRVPSPFTTAGAAPAAGAAAPEHQTPARYNELLAKQLKRYAQPPPPELLNQQFSKLKHIVHELQQRGVRVVFFEMPVDCRLTKLPRAQAIRGAFRQHFPPSTYSYVAPPQCSAFQTLDGLHLNTQSAKEYVRLLQAHTAQLGR